MFFGGEVEDDDLLFKEPELIDVGLLALGGELNLKSFPQLDVDLLLLSAASAAAKGSGRPFHAELPNGLSNSVVDLEGDVEDAKGSLSAEKGSKLSDPFFFIPLFVIVVGTANGSSLEANGSLKPTSLNGSSVNSNSA